MNAICLVIDRLHVGQMGAYGNAWIETPSLDRLASEAFVFDQALINTPRLNGLYRSYWQGWHPLGPQDPPSDLSTLPALLSEEGVRTTLLTDEWAVAQHPLAYQFEELIEFDTPPHGQVAEQIDQTRLARCFAQTIDWLDSARGPFLLWCHLGGMGKLWDAPLEFRRRYCEEGDPPPPDSEEVPCRMLEEDYDPDLLLGISQAYAGQVSLLDTCVGALLEYLGEKPAGEETLLVLLGARGFPLGEHRNVGGWEEMLYSELVHVPWMMRFPDLSGAAGRSQTLVEPADLWRTLLEYFRVGSEPPSPVAKSLLPVVAGEVESIRDRLCIAGLETERAIRTPGWYMRLGGRPELFAKPEDRWEVNDVADRCADVVDSLRQALSQYELCLESGQLANLPPLNEILLFGLE